MTVLFNVVGYYGETLLTYKVGSSGPTIALRFYLNESRFRATLVPQDLTLSLVSFHQEL